MPRAYKDRLSYFEKKYLKDLNFKKLQQLVCRNCKQNEENFLSKFK